MTKNPAKKQVRKSEIKAVKYKFSQDECTLCGEEACEDVFEVTLQNETTQTASLFGCDPLHNAELYDVFDRAVI